MSTPWDPERKRRENNARSMRRLMLLRSSHNDPGAIAGPVELLGPELVPSWDFSASTGWSLSSGPNITGGVLNMSGSGSATASGGNLGAIALNEAFKLVVVVVSTSANPKVYVGLNSGDTSIFPLTSFVVGTNIFYFNAAASQASSVVAFWNNSTASNAVIDSISLKRVL